MRHIQRSAALDPDVAWRVRSASVATIERLHHEDAIADRLYPRATEVNDSDEGLARGRIAPPGGVPVRLQPLVEDYGHVQEINMLRLDSGVFAVDPPSGTAPLPKRLSAPMG